jgi:hypothetical protein
LTPEFFAGPLTSAAESGILKLRSWHQYAGTKTNHQPTKTMGDKSPKANQKKNAQKQAKAGNASKAKQQAAAAKQAGIKK